MEVLGETACPTKPPVSAAPDPAPRPRIGTAGAQHLTVSGCRALRGCRAREGGDGARGGPAAAFPPRRPCCGRHPHWKLPMPEKHGGPCLQGWQAGSACRDRQRGATAAALRRLASTADLEEHVRLWWQERLQPCLPACVRACFVKGGA
eukprot:277620-Chlamydomonas_euryale.AAC.2